MISGITGLDLACIAVYAACLFAIAIWHSRKLKREDDIFLAGRSMSRWPIAASMYMALFSTNTFLGVTGWVNRPDGTVWIGLQTVGIVMAMPFVIWLYPSLFFRLRITSAYQYLEKRFNRAVCSGATVFFLVSRLMWMATIVYSASLVLSMMLGGQGQQWAILIIAALATTFALLGGMHAVIWTDVMQFGVLLAGVVTMAVLGTRLSGGMSHVLTIGSSMGRLAAPPLFSLSGDMSVIGVLLLGFTAYLSSAGADQVVLQQYLTAKDEHEAKASLWRNGLLFKPVSLIYPLLGLIMFAYYQVHPEVRRLMRIPDDALPVFVANVLPPGARGLMTAAMIAAVLTSVQSGLAAFSAAVQVNFIKPALRRPLSDRQSVLLARILLVATGTCICAVAFWIRHLGQHNSIIQVLNIVMYPFSGVLLGIFLLGMLSHRASANGAMIGAVVGFLATVMAAGAHSWPARWPTLDALGRISNFYYGTLAALFTVGVGLAASHLFAPPPPGKIRGLTRRSLPPPVAGSDVPHARSLPLETKR